MEDLLAGAVDLHIHAGPDIFDRNVDSISAGVAAKAAGMRAIVVKSHSTDTSGRAITASQISGFPVYGAVVLNYPVGGFNPYAVRECAIQGGKVVWFPTIAARHFITGGNGADMLAKAIPPGVAGLTALDCEGELKPEVVACLEQVAEHDLTLASGHLAEAETLAVFRKAAEFGIRKLIVTHPHLFVGMSAAGMRELAGLGAYIEITDHGTFEARRDIVQAVGAERCIISTDGGTVSAPPPVERMERNARGLLDAGIPYADVRAMLTVNPAFALGLDHI
ncbi:MAG: DUF6282 family protein [Propionibacteriaceae bacterium]|jgi:hypothetical protein|nr:DUF6282 family protein [Propionibacteriaceae bacterium]